MLVSLHKGVCTLHARFPKAERVYLMGRFNHWSPDATPLIRIDEELWETKLSLSAELRELCFFVVEPGEAEGRVKLDDVPA